ncbi:hypothetical protein O3P69_001431 [Scylla paramamosain]|uniref:WAP domain-containing protein n=1 Tax=Scylla paramamosain TaxID=85552 RepID=A0AAW0UXQ5_SCYPA
MSVSRPRCSAPVPPALQSILTIPKHRSLEPMKSRFLQRYNERLAGYSDTGGGGDGMHGGEPCMIIGVPETSTWPLRSSLSGNGPFPGSGHIPHSNGQNPLVNGQCPANFRLAAATFPVGQGPSPCSITRDCPLGQLCCPVIDSVSDLCLPPESGFPGGHILNNKPVVFPGQVASHVHQGRCPPALNLAVVRFPEGLPIYCKTARDCPYRQLCCPAINPTSTICRKSSPHNTRSIVKRTHRHLDRFFPFCSDTMRGLLATVTLVVAATVCTAGTLYDNRCPKNFDVAVVFFPNCNGNGPFPGSGHIPHSNGQNPLVNGQCPANFRLEAATFPVGQTPAPCRITKDCPLGQLCCPVIHSVSDLCLPPESGFPGGHKLNKKPVVFPGQVASNVHHGRCPPPLNLAAAFFPPGLPIFCKTARDCPYRQLCCPAINPTSTICRDPAQH